MNNAITTKGSNGMTVIFSAETDNRIVSANERGNLAIVRCATKADAKALMVEAKALGLKGVVMAHGVTGIQFPVSIQGMGW